MLPLVTSEQNLRLQKIITAIGIVLFAIKLVAWYLTGSVAILTDALESTVNVVAGFIGIYSLTVSAKPRDWDHPYGHGKAEFLSAAVEGTLIAVSGMIIIYEAINNLIHPHEIRRLNWGMILIAATALINYGMGLACIRMGKRNNSLALIASGKHLQTDTYSTLGIIVALILLTFFPLGWIDSAVAIGFAILILVTGYRIIRSSIAGIMDEADVQLLNSMVAFLNKHRKENWVDLHNLRIIKYGSIIHIDCHLTVPWYLNVNEAHQEIEELASLVKQQYGESLELFVHSDGCLDFSCSICNKSKCPARQKPFQHQLEWTMKNVASNKKHRLPE